MCGPEFQTGLEQHGKGEECSHFRVFGGVSWNIEDQGKRTELNMTREDSNYSKVTPRRFPTSRPSKSIKQ